MLRFPVGTSSQELILSDVVLSHFERFRQTRPGLSEAGGQLFAKIAHRKIIVQVATGPRSGDKRGRTHYEPDRRAEQKEIDQMHIDGLHYVGDWHTHPDAIPSPSYTDLRSISETARKSRHSLSAFVMIIVGTAELPAALHVSIHNGDDHAVLKPLLE